MRTISGSLDMSLKPIGYSFRADDRIFAGEYPVNEWDRGIRERQVRNFTSFGITHFIDLTDPGEMPPYECFLPQGTGCIHFPIPNGGVPQDAGAVRGLCRRIEEILEESPSNRIYIHCHGGVGRTGTIVSCWYIYNGLPADDALALMKSRYATNPKSSWMRSPENSLQVGFVREFASGNYR